MKKNYLREVLSIRCMVFIFFSSLFPVIHFLNVNKVQLLPIHYFKFVVYFCIIFISALFLIYFTKRFILRFLEIEKITFVVAITLLVFFVYNPIVNFIVSVGIPKIVALPLFLCIPPILGIFLSRYQNILKIFSVMIVVAVLIPLSQIVYYSFEILILDKDKKLHAVRERLDYDFVKAKNPLNVYYFVPDLYMRSDRVKKILGHDNNPFINKLSKHGFYIANQSYSNYPTTFLSVSSALAMDYVATEDMEPFLNKNKFYRILAGHNPTVNRFKKHGYRFARASPGRWDPGRCNGVEDICLTEGFGVSEVEYNFWRNSAFHRIASKFNLVNDYKKTTFKDITQSLINLDMDEPTFVFGHITIPHPPYIFDRNCNPQKNLGEVSSWWSDKMKLFYLEELICANKQILDLVEFINKKDPNSIIVIQSDTGSHWDYKSKATFSSTPLSEWTTRDLEENFANLTAFKIPKKYQNRLYPSISQVNAFRLIFSIIEDREPSFLPDYSYATHYEFNPEFGKVHKYDRKAK